MAHITWLQLIRTESSYSVNIAQGVWKRVIRNQMGLVDDELGIKWAFTNALYDEKDSSWSLNAKFYPESAFKPRILLNTRFPPANSVVFSFN